MLQFPLACYIRASSSSNKRDEFHKKSIRPLANNPPNISPSRYTSNTFDKKVYEGYLKEMEPLKEQVRTQIVQSRKWEIAERLYLIDAVQRLGLSYHFKEEIDEQLERAFYGKVSSGSDYPYDLTTVALQFRLLRQHGLSITSDVFNEFTENGKFKNALRNDIMGLLNLYEAAHLRTHNDHVLEEGLVFSRNHLKSRAQGSYPFLEKQVQHALQQPLYRGIPIVEAHHFTSIYEEDKLKNKTLLQLAKLDHNSLQMLYKEELSTLIRWWKDFESITSLPQVRDRMVESYFLALSTFFEPQYAKSREFYAKMNALGVLMDDLFDAYCTPEEMTIFTPAIERWDLNEIDGLPECLILCFRALAKMIDEFGSYAVQHGKLFALNHLKESWKEFSRNSQIEGDWLASNKLPPFADYIENGLKTSGLKVILFVWSMPMESATEAVYDWFSGDPPVSLAAMKIARLQNDVASYQFDKDKGIATGIDCYMRDYNVSEDTAKMKFWEMIEDAWKDLNEGYCSNPKALITQDMLIRVVNQPRIMNALYREIDGFTYSKNIIEPILDQVLLHAFTL